MAEAVSTSRRAVRFFFFIYLKVIIHVIKYKIYTLVNLFYASVAAASSIQNTRKRIHNPSQWFKVSIITMIYYILCVKDLNSVSIRFNYKIDRVVRI